MSVNFVFLFLMWEVIPHVVTTVVVEERKGNMHVSNPEDAVI